MTRFDHPSLQDPGIGAGAGGLGVALDDLRVLHVGGKGGAGHAGGGDFEENLAEFAPYKDEQIREGFQIVGTSGTVTTVAASHLGLKRYDRTKVDGLRMTSDQIDRVIRMLLIHDLVEIDVGDVPIHSANGLAHGSADTQAKELAAAERIFGLLPNALASDLKLLWQEFEAAETPDAVFAKSLDRVQPVMANLMSGGGTWVTYRVTVEQLESRVGAKVARGAPGIWHWVRAQTAIYFEGAAQLGQ